MKVELRAKEDQNFWNGLFSISFAVLLGAAVWWVYCIRGSFPTSIPLFDAFIIALAIFRITRLIVYDKITRFAREWFVQKREIVGEGGIAMIELTQFPRGFRRTVHDLLQCPWCVGVWVALAVVFGYFVFSFAWLVILILATAGAGSLFQVTGNLIGWHAEYKKLETFQKEAGI